MAYSKPSKEAIVAKPKKNKTKEENVGDEVRERRRGGSHNGKPYGSF